MLKEQLRKKEGEEEEEEKASNLAIVSANNNYAGFSPYRAANIFRKMIGLPEATWYKQEDDKSYLHSSSSYIQQNHD
jgi:hypothetical protein